MKVRELREGLTLLAKLLSSWQAKSASGDLERLASLFERHDELSVAEFCAVVEKSSSERPQRPSPPRPIDGSSIQSLLQEMRQAENSQEFEALVKKSEKLNKSDLDALANAYSGVEEKYRKKVDAIKAIREKRAADVSSRKERISVDGIF